MLTGTLGCGEVNVVVQPRGGSNASARGVGSARDWTSLEWHRLPNDQSGAQLRVEGRAQCCDWASRIRAWEHELVVFYDGYRAWSGPVTSVHWVGDELRIDCKDRMEWMRRRKIHRNHSYNQGEDLATIFDDLVEDALSVDTSPNLRRAKTLSGTVVDAPEGRKYLAGQNTYANDALNELARTGVEWTCIDKTVYIRGPLPITNDTPTLRPVHFEDEPEALSDGDAFGTRFYVVGAGVGEDVDAIVGTNEVDTTLEATYGVHEHISNEPFIRDPASATASAKSAFALYGKHGIPFYLLGGILNPGAPITLADLVPGRVLHIQAEDPCKPVPQFVRLLNVEGNIGPEHQYIKIVTEPIGATSV